MERPAFAQEFWGEDEVGAAEFGTDFGGIANRNSGFDDHDRLRVDGHDVTYHCFNGASVEVVGFGVVIGRRGDDDKVRAFIGIPPVERGPEVKLFVLEVVLDFGIFNRRFLAVQHRHLFGDDVERNNFVVLGQKDSVGETDVTGAGNCDFHAEDFG